MIFFGKHFWNEEMPVYPFIQDLVRKGKYKNLLLTLTDSSEEAVAQLLEFRKSDC